MWTIGTNATTQIKIQMAFRQCADAAKVMNLIASVMGADDGIRTRDLRFTKPLLYQLSYVGAETERGNMPSARQAASRSAA